MSSINIMSINKFNAANTQAVERIGVNNLDLYIPRINENYTEDEIKFMFADMAIGLVDYVDFVATKDPETKEIKFYSAFLRLREWKPDGYWYNKIIVEKQNKIQVSRSEFWIILAAKTPLSRSKVNTHQLAAYTDELYVRVEAIEKSAVENVTVSSTHFQNLLAKSEAQAKQIDELLKIVAEQSNQIARINDVLFKNQVEETATRPRALTIEDLREDSGNEFDGFKCKICSTELDTEKQLYFHSSVCKKDKPYPNFRPVDDDDCFLSKPVFKNWTETVDKKRDIISGSFSFDLEDALGPVAKSMGITRDEARKGLIKEFADSKRAKNSKKYCGNM